MITDEYLDEILNGTSTLWLFDPEEDEALDLERFGEDIPDEIEEDDIAENFWDDIMEPPEINHIGKDIDWEKQGLRTASLCGIQYIEDMGLLAEYTSLKDTLYALDVPGKVIFDRCAYVMIGDFFFLISIDCVNYGFIVREIELDNVPELVYQLLCF